MCNKFLNGLENLSHEKLTENGALALDSTNSSLLDLFGTIGAARDLEDIELLTKFHDAYLENPLLTMKTLFYARDIRGTGLGEREVFKKIAKYLANEKDVNIKLNMKLIPEYGRWDDLYCFVDTPFEKDAFELMKSQFNEDLKNLSEGKTVSLLGKWLKSINASSKETKKLGRLTAKYFGLNEKQYRTDISKLRKAIDVVECKMSSNNWTEISYSGVPSYAMKNYRESFFRHDAEGFNTYLDSVKSGDVKINAATLFPYDIVRDYHTHAYSIISTTDDVLEAQWKALPNYVDDKNFLIMTDVSGSMNGQPMDVSVSLAIYFAQRTKGIFHNKFLTFSERPSLVELKDEYNLRDSINKTLAANWGMNTNLKAAFELVLKAAKKGNATQEEMPTAIVVITDMEIDDAGTSLNFTDLYKKKFEEAGYKMPVIVWWNVNARQFTFHANKDEQQVRFISGCSAGVFDGLCKHMGTSPIEMVLEILNSERYSKIIISE